MRRLQLPRRIRRLGHHVHPWIPVTNIAEEFAGHAYCNASNFLVTYLNSWETQEDKYGTRHPNRGGLEVIARRYVEVMGVTAPQFVTPPNLQRTASYLPPARCEEGDVVVGASCAEPYCGELELMCKPPAPGVALGAPYETRTVNETNNPTFRYCPERLAPLCFNEVGLTCDGGVMVGLSCSGNHCRDVSLTCRPLTKGRLHDCHWVTSVSDETCWEVFAAGKVAAGVQCSGTDCDFMRHWVCDVLPEQPRPQRRPLLTTTVGGVATARGSARGHFS